MKCPKCDSQTRVRETREPREFRGKAPWVKQLGESHSLKMRRRHCPTHGVFVTAEIEIEVLQELVEGGFWPDS
jgi:hypothetical protein